MQGEIVLEPLAALITKAIVAHLEPCHAIISKRERWCAWQIAALQQQNLIDPAPASASRS